MSFDGIRTFLQPDIQAGEKVALVGASGAGKSTLVNVLLGLYPADDGMVFFNDVPVSKIGLDTVREHVSTVLQSPALFNDTVRQNITMGRQYSDDAIWEAIRIAQIETVIQDLPEQLDTIIGRDGVKLSGGQRQRIAIARAVLQDAQILLLDEATSALDAENEKLVQAALEKLMQNKTTLVVAHRLATVQKADRIVVMDQGKIVESGTHEELISRDGLYAHLAGLQFGV